MSKLSLIIKREFYAKVKNKTFIIMTFLTPIIFLIVAFLIGYLSKVNNDKVNRYGVYDKNHIIEKGILKDSNNLKFIDLSDIPFDQAKKMAFESYKGLINVPSEVNSVVELETKVQLLSDKTPKYSVISSIERMLNKYITKYKLEQIGIDSKTIEKNTSKVSLVLRKKDSNKVNIKYDNEIKAYSGAALGYFIMMFILIYGNFVMRSVIEEKSNRIIEIIISSVKPFELMLGKITGNAFAGIFQFCIWVCSIVLIYAVASSFIAVDVNTAEELQTINELGELKDLEKMILNLKISILEMPYVKLIIGFLFFFLGGYFLYSSLYAAIGAAVDSETDSQQFLMPIMLPLILGVYIGMFTVIDEPHGTIATLFSFIPFTSPIVMTMRIPLGAPLWQIILSILVLFATFVIVVWVSGKIYRIGILSYGKKPTWKQLYKWIKLS